MTYLLDSSVLIDAKNRHYGFDIVPGFWTWIEEEHANSNVFVVQQVADEITGGGDELAAWLSAMPASFRMQVSPSDTPSLQNLSAWAVSVGFEPSALAEFLSVADYYLVAQALTLGATVVTMETMNQRSMKKVKIPDACQSCGVECITPFEMLRAEGAVLG